MNSPKSKIMILILVSRRLLGAICPSHLSSVILPVAFGVAVLLTSLSAYAHGPVDRGDVSHGVNPLGAEMLGDFSQRDELRQELIKKFRLRFVETIPANIKLGVYLVDPQVAFTVPGEPLYVLGAETDMDVIDRFVRNNTRSIRKLFISFDSHGKYYVGDPSFWVNRLDEHPALFSVIEPQDVLDGIWRAANPHHQQRAIDYANCLLGHDVIFIWPEHGIVGSASHPANPTIEGAVKHWVSYWSSRTVLDPNPFWIFKALNSFTESFSGVHSECPNEDPNTQVARLLVDEMAKLDTIIVAGEAFNFCVSGALDLVDVGIDPSKLIVGFDASSPIESFRQRTFDDMEKALAHGIRFALLDELEVTGPFPEAIEGRPPVNYALPELECLRFRPTAHRGPGGLVHLRRCERLDDL
ncbi:hypothetical protein MYX76_06315 [Desulfobacterota bacterium AH_259_B03_O07]|nr:hypothetical protein [Desulfobacterota bacterium AH_259_B03_O07]